MGYKRRWVIIVTIPLLVFLAGCVAAQEDLALLEPVSLPPESGPPPNVPSEPTQDATAEPKEISTAALTMPTAIARVIGMVFSTPEPTATATMVPTPVPTLTPTATPCSSPGQIVTGTYQSEAAGISSYRIYLPPCYQPEGPSYPTLYMLPGNIHTDSIWDNLGLDEVAEAAINRGDIPPLLIVMADSGTLLNNTSGGPWSYETQILEDLVPFIESNYCAWPDPEGRAIGGMSRGGYWALEIAFRHPEQFASVGGHSASLLDLYGGPDVVPQSTGLANDLGDLRMYFDIGANDWVIDSIRQLHEDMEAADIQHVWVLNEGRHEDGYWASHTEEYLTWYSAPWPRRRAAYPDCLGETEMRSR